jgi:DNA repair protein RecN (Recombination protein N)
VIQAAAAVGEARRHAAPALASAVETHLRALAMPGARFEVAVGGDDPGLRGPNAVAGLRGPNAVAGLRGPNAVAGVPDRDGAAGAPDLGAVAGDQVTFLLGANPGEAALPLAKVASGGELARACLAARLVLTEAPPTLVFDEVDAGVGGRAALAVGRALASLATAHQVLVVTHLPQVAAFADHQVAVTKDESGGRTVARAEILSGRDRVVELSRMLSGQPASATAHGHAEELLATASRERGR